MLSSFRIVFSIAIYTTVMYTLLLIHNVVLIKNYHENIKNAKEMDYTSYEDDSDYDGSRLRMDEFEGTHVYTVTEELNWYAVMWTLSVLLIVGVKLQIHQAIAPWLLMGGIVVVIGFIAGTIIGNPEKYILELSVIAIQAVTWIPVYLHYKALRESFYFKPKNYVRPNKYAGAMD
ncbi:uncharacterized protein LOC131803406 [Musca domestica]|uniref:Uncharacterized protein LOC101888517 n=1 Tax=Musca domestica TaxID=7370 RepID=A0A1I8ME85_MUSDO|nr:uncharacterized protein LOC101888517 [Musca domestica]XP_058980676.1 uncharacterized protein LOC131803406 [Musca domestica]